jgi:hypothetical protein
MLTGSIFISPKHFIQQKCFVSRFFHIRVQILRAKYFGLRTAIWVPSKTRFPLLTKSTPEHYAEYVDVADSTARWCHTEKNIFRPGFT